MDEVILLLGHGSRDPDGVRELCALAAAVRGAAPGGRAVALGVLEFAQPGVPAIGVAIDQAVAAGARRILAVPLLLVPASHARVDVPAQIARARERHPHLDLRLAPPLGPHPSLLAIAEERLATLDRQVPSGSPTATAVLLVGRGTSDAAANADLFRLGRLLWERQRSALVECCFAGTAVPLVPAGIDRCVRLGARRILVLPYLLTTGLLVKRIHRQALAARAAYPGVLIAVGAHLGIHPALVQLILARAAAAVEPTAAPVEGPAPGMGETATPERTARDARALPDHLHPVGVSELREGGSG